MEQEATLYRQIQRRILQDIYKGTYPYGTKLPSLQTLCEQFGVGRNTIRAALALLEKDGALQRIKGSCARVSLDIQHLENNRYFLYRMACSRNGIAHVYDALGILMPVAIHAALQHADAKHLEELQCGIRQLTQKEHTLYELNEALQQLYLQVLGFLGNTYLLELAKQLLDFLYLPYAKQENCEEALADNKGKLSETLAKILLFVMQNNPFMMKKTIRYFCEATKKDSMRYLDRVCEGIHPQKDIEFEWYTGREVSFLYMKTAGSMVRDIAENRYPDGQLLNLEQLSERYAVSLRTMRRTIKFLNDLQLVETRNGLGSRIVYSAQQKISCMQQAQIQTLLDYYICMLELTELLARATLSSCMERCTQEELDVLAERIQAREGLSPESVLDIIKHHENPCIRNIAERLSESVSGSMLIRTLFQHTPEKQIEQNVKGLRQALVNRERRKVIQLMLELLHSETDRWKKQKC